METISFPLTRKQKQLIRKMWSAVDEKESIAVATDMFIRLVECKMNELS